MPALFTLPKVVPLSSAGLLLPGAKLTFTQTGTTTPQNTYTDIGLTIAHANPVVADSAGVFAPIYLDASLPDYRVKLTTSADVLVYQVDDYPAGSDTGQVFRLVATAPELILEQTGASANNGKWSIRASAEQLTIALLNDAESVRTDIARFDRSGTVADSINFLATNVQANSLELAGSIGVAKSGITERSNTATLADDPDLTLSVPVAGLYAIDLVLTVIGLTGGSGGFQYRLAIVNGSSGVIGGGGVESIDSAAGVVGSLTSSLTGVIYAAPLQTAQIVRREFLRLSPSGAMTLKLQWAQATSNADVTRLDSASLLAITRIAA